MIFLPVQCRMARAGLGWGVRELAAAAKVSVDTVARFERGDELKERTVEAIQRALEAGGIEFIDENGGGPGLRLKKRPHGGGGVRLKKPARATAKR
jgi:transcriptional regulator with XRE-family HTH domain